MVCLQKNRCCSCGIKGFSLVELLVVISIIAILTSVATLAFNQMHRKSLAESQIRQLATDINELRIRAMTTKQPHGITLTANSYVLSAFTSTTVTYTSPTQQTVLPGGAHNVIFPMNSNATGTAYANEMYEIDERGTVTRKFKDGALTGSLGFTVYLGGNGTDGAVDCLSVHVLRANAGKVSAGVCNAK